MNLKALYGKDTMRGAGDVYDDTTPLHRVGQVIAIG